MVKPPIKHTLVYATGAIGLVTFASWTLWNQNLGYPYQLWFTDMMDAQSVRAYERPMLQLPEGVVARTVSPEESLARNVYVENYDRMTPEGQALTQPYAVDADLLETGEWSYTTYCEPCHAAAGAGTGAVTDNSKGKRFGMPGLALAGDAGVVKTRTDGYLYLTIRNGGAIMPSYSWAMNDKEMWSIVAYLRTLPDSELPAAPAPDSAEG